MPTLDFAGTVPFTIGLNKSALRIIYNNCLRDLEQLSQKNGRIELVFVDDDLSRDINRRYAGNDYPTDVLSFDYDDSSTALSQSHERACGLIAINTDQLLRQAQLHHVTAKDEVVLLFIHGLLHLSGYDHQTVRQQASFLARQSDMIKLNGYNNRDFSWSH